MFKMNTKQAITQMNRDMHFFQKKIKNYQLTFGNVTDKFMTKNILDTLRLIKSLLENSHEIYVGDTSVNNDLDHVVVRNTYFCELCKLDISRNIQTINKHLATSDHQRLEANWRSRINGVTRHLHNHVLNVQNSIDLQYQQLANNKPPKNKAKKNKKKSKDVEASANMDLLDEPLKDLLKKSIILQTTEDEAEITDNDTDFSKPNTTIQNSLNEILSEEFPDVKIYTFGSRANGTGNISSDLDVYIDIDQSYHTLGLDKTIMERVKAVERILTDANGEEWNNLEILSTRVPVLKVFNEKEKIYCDITFSDGLGDRNTKLVNYICNLQPLVRQMIVFLKEWARLTGIGNEINNYALTLLIIFYLQTKHLLPSIKLLQKDIEKPMEIGPWNVDFTEGSIESMNLHKSDDLNKHLKGFFHYYAIFETYSTHTFCTYLGTAVPNEYFSVERKVKSLKRYQTFAETYADKPELLFGFSHMNVQGPFNLVNNAAKDVTEEGVQQFVELCKASLEYLLKN